MIPRLFIKKHALQAIKQENLKPTEETRAGRTCKQNSLDKLPCYTVSAKYIPALPACLLSPSELNAPRSFKSCILTVSSKVNL
jgi:hypothetical protein